MPDISTIRSHAALALKAYKLASGSNTAFFEELVDAKKTSDESFAAILAGGLNALGTNDLTTRHFLTILDYEVKTLNKKLTAENALAEINKLDEEFKKRFYDSSAWTTKALSWFPKTDAYRFSSEFQAAYKDFVIAVQADLPKLVAQAVATSATAVNVPVPQATVVASTSDGAPAAASTSAQLLRAMPLGVVDSKTGAPDSAKVEEFPDALKKKVKEKLIEYAADDYEFAELNKAMSALIKADTVFMKAKNQHYTWVDDVFTPNCFEAQFRGSITRKEYVTREVNINEWRAVLQRHYGVVVSQTLHYSTAKPSAERQEAKELIDKFFNKAVAQRKQIDKDAEEVFPENSPFFKYAKQLSPNEWEQIKMQGINKYRERDTARLHQSSSSPDAGFRRMAHA